MYITIAFYLLSIRNVHQLPELINWSWLLNVSNQFEYKNDVLGTPTAELPEQRTCKQLNWNLSCSITMLLFMFNCYSHIILEHTSSKWTVKLHLRCPKIYELLNKAFTSSNCLGRCFSRDPGSVLTWMLSVWSLHPDMYGVKSNWLL